MLLCIVQGLSIKKFRIGCYIFGLSYVESNNKQQSHRPSEMAISTVWRVLLSDSAIAALCSDLLSSKGQHLLSPS